MIPYDRYGDKLDYYKCKMGENGNCQRVSKLCSDIKNETKCNDYSLSNYKKCVYINNECIEQYKDCDSYTNSGENIDKSTCESIQLNDDKYKCAFISGTPHICVIKEKGCRDFTIESYQDYCNSINHPSVEKKCSYSDNSCTERYKSCSELENDNRVNEEIYKKCKKNETNNGNKEVNTIENNETNEINENNSNGRSIKVKLNVIYMIILMSLLF